MTSADLPVDSEASVLFQASLDSLNKETDPFLLCRVYPITICVDIPDDEDAAAGLADTIIGETRRLLEGSGCELIGEWGPFYASKMITLFPRRIDPEDGRSFREHLEEISRQLRGIVVRAARSASKAAQIGTCVGTIGVLYSPPGQAAETFHLSPEAFRVVMVAGTTSKMGELGKGLFFGNKAKKKQDDG